MVLQQFYESVFEHKPQLPSYVAFLKNNQIQFFQDLILKELENYQTSSDTFTQKPMVPFQFIHENHGLFMFVKQKTGTKGSFNFEVFSSQQIKTRDSLILKFPKTGIGGLSTKSYTYSTLQGRLIFTFLSLKAPHNSNCFKLDNFLQRQFFFIGLAYQGKDIVFRFIIEYSSLKILALR